MTSAFAGVLAMMTASTIWGLSSLFYKLLSPVPVLEVLAHRSLWSLVFFTVVLAIQGRGKDLLRAARPSRSLVPIIAAALLISANWCGFIFSVQVGRALEASLGYYIFPLVAVALGVLVFKDSLAPLQKTAILIATAGVLLLCFGLGLTPWIALFLAGTFGLYGVVKKLSPLGPLISTAAEVLVLSPLVLTWLVGVHTAGWGGTPEQSSGVFGQDLFLSVLLILSGPLTGLPLLLFSFASKRISMVSLGLIQYFNPTLQFLVAVLIFGEAFTLWHLGAFALIWTALSLYSFDAARRS